MEKETGSTRHPQITLIRDQLGPEADVFSDEFIRKLWDLADDVLIDIVRAKSEYLKKVQSERKPEPPKKTVNFKDPEGFLNERQVGELTSMSLSTLRQWRFCGKGPKYHKVGRAVRYKIQDVSDWMNERAVQPWNE